MEAAKNTDLEMMANCFSCDENHYGRFGADALGNLADELSLFLEGNDTEIPNNIANYLHFFMRRMQMASDVAAKMAAESTKAVAS